MKKKQINWLWLLLIVINILVALCVALLGTAHAGTVEPQLTKGLWNQEARDKYPDGLPWATLNATQVNFREGPGTEYRVVENWSARIAVEVIREHAGWYQVLHWTHPDPMWVWGEYLDFA